MILTAVPRPVRTRRTKYVAMIEQFKAMDVSCVKVENVGTSIYGTCTNINRCAKRCGYLNVKAFICDKGLYIERTDMEE